MVQSNIAEHFEGFVSCANERGFKLDGRDGWLNWSKYAGDVVPVQRGDRVIVGLDKAGFVRAVEVYGNAPQFLSEPEPEQPRQPVDRETRIGRLAVLNTATAILSSGGQAAQLADVLSVAAELEAWVGR